MNKKIIILDLDGTVADCTHRLHHIKGENRDYKAFYDALVDDKPIQHIIDIVKALHLSQEYMIFVVTGRPITHLRETQLWLNEHFVPFHAVFMRPENDFRKDYIVKKEILDKIRNEFWEPTAVLDDRQSVCDMWRENGVPCLQVAPGDFDKPKYRPGKLILLVGPSGAGKSTYCDKLVDVHGYYRSSIISSDEIRSQICLDFQDQSKNKQVFETLHSIVKSRIEGGLTTIVDATNIKTADRKSILNLVPEDTYIEYYIIDRPLEEKLKTGGWRLKVENKGVGLIERHDRIFKSNLKDILAGDHDQRVRVIDMREE